MGKVLVVGLCCIDLVNYVQKYPVEDSDTRVFEQITALGGNATNSCVVLNQLDPNGYELFASVPEKKNMVLESLIEEQKLNLRRVERKNSTIPTSTIIVNELSGTRTILHFRGNLPELQLQDFVREFPSLDEYSWVHFEGRNFGDIFEIVKYCDQRRDPKVTRLSIELEKIRDFNWYDKLIPLVDVIFMSKDFARHLGYRSMEETIDNIHNRYNLTGTTVIVPWGEQGVVGKESKNSPPIYQRAFQPPQVVDTLAAGDCFIGVALHFLNKRRPLKEVLERASIITGRKCGQRGLLNLDLGGL